MKKIFWFIVVIIILLLIFVEIIPGLDETLSNKPHNDNTNISTPNNTETNIPSNNQNSNENGDTSIKPVETPRIKLTGYDSVDLILGKEVNCLFRVKPGNVISLGNVDSKYAEYNDDTTYVIKVSIDVQRTPRNLEQALLDTINTIINHPDYKALNEKCEIIFYYSPLSYDDAPTLCSDITMYVQDVYTLETYGRVQAASQLDYASVSDLSLTEAEINSVFAMYKQLTGN